MTDETPTAPDCFGDLDIVFPMGDDGLRASPAACLACDRKTACLAAALKQAGVTSVWGLTLARAR